MNPLWISTAKEKKCANRTQRQRLQIKRFPPTTTPTPVCVYLLKAHYGGPSQINFWRLFERKRGTVVLPFQLKRVKHNKDSRKTMDRAIDDFKKKLNKSGLKEAPSPQGCHFFLFFCPIISRAGTDIDNALKYLDQVKAPKRVIMVVLHHTIDPEKTILDSNSTIMRGDIFAVDCLFSDDGLLTCEKNMNAINKIAQDSKSKNLNSYYCLKKDGGNPYQLTDQNAENHPLMSNESSMHQPNTREDGRSEERNCLCQALCLIYECLCCCFKRSK